MSLSNGFGTKAERATIYHTAGVPFEAARRVGVFASGHRSARLHGHSFTARLRACLEPGWAPFPGAEADALEAHLQDAVAPLDYQLLNDLIEVPTDENLARWLHGRLTLNGVESVGIHSARDQGVDLDAANVAHVWHRFRFEAAHQLPNVHAGHPCGRMHGHGFEVIIHARTELGSAHYGIDFDDIASHWAPLQSLLHHSCLNDVPGLANPTSELIAHFIWQRLVAVLPQLSWVTVYETRTAGCHYNGAQYRIWKKRRFEAATRLARAPEGDARRGLHGHSYVARLHLTAPLDEVMGWTLDYGDVSARFAPLHARLDHHDVTELNNAGDLVSVARWVCERLAGTLPQLDRFDLMHKPGSGCVLSWNDEGPALPA